MSNIKNCKPRLYTATSVGNPASGKKRLNAKQEKGKVLLIKVVIQNKILYENNVLLKKILEIDFHQSNLSPKAVSKHNQNPLFSPKRSLLTESKRQKTKNIQRQNAVNHLTTLSI